MCERSSLEQLHRELITCQRCPRLVSWRETAAHNKPLRHRNETYWAAPVPGFGDPQARLLILGLAPSANGANRTGRMFTGDASGDFLYRALYESGLASQPIATSRADGLRLRDVFISAAVRCAPPDNLPNHEERSACRHWLEAERQYLEHLRVVIALGHIAHQTWFQLIGLPQRSYPFAHAKTHLLPGHPTLIDSYHVSRQNTQTGRLTFDMFMQVIHFALSLF